MEGRWGISMRSTSGIIARAVALLLACLMMGLAQQVSSGESAAESTLSKSDVRVRIGVLSYRALNETWDAWSPTAAWLEARIPGYHFQIVPLYFEELRRAVAEGQVAFVLCNPEEYVLLRADHGLTAIATLMPVVEGHPVNRFGGVIFTRSERDDIQTLRDLKGKRISAVSVESLGGYLAQAWTLYKTGIDARKDFQLRFIGMPHDAVVTDVLSGNADAGFVRTGVLEASILKGRVEATAIKLIHPQSVMGFGQRLSTDLYPEWPLAAMPNIDPGLKKSIVLALLGMEPDSLPAQQGGFYGFAPPANYGEVEALMVRLSIHPFEKQFGWRDVFERYALWVVILLMFVVAAGVLATRHLRHTNLALNKALDTTDELARQRTQLLASLGEGVYGIDRTGHCSFINPAALNMLGFDLGEVLGQDQHMLFHHSKPDGSPYPHGDCPVRKTLLDGQRREGTETFVCKNGKPLHVRMTVTAVQEYGEVMGAVVVFQDITQELQRLKRMQLLDAALQSAYNGIVITDRHGVIEWANPAMLRLSGYDLEETLGQGTSLLGSDEQSPEFYENLWKTILSGTVWHGDLVNRRKDGSHYHEEMTITPVVDENGAINHFIAVKQDVTERKRMEEELQLLATTDSLTGVANRRHFLQRVSEELKRVKRYGGTCVLIMLDLDHFKLINDTWGHATGDQVLRHFTRVVQGHLRDTDLLGRLGGEEFGVLLPETDRDGAANLAERMRKHVETEPASSEKGEIAYTVSLGLTCIDAQDGSPDAPLARADEALYQAKSNGRNQLAVVVR